MVIGLRQRSARRVVSSGALPRRHIAKPGECLASIALLYHFGFIGWPMVGLPMNLGR
jgi:hypothetical protein